MALEPLFHLLFNTVYPLIEITAVYMTGFLAAVIFFMAFISIFKTDNEGQ
jgi:hypothetical protein